jgi:hypothetical protein
MRPSSSISPNAYSACIAEKQTLSALQRNPPTRAGNRLIVTASAVGIKLGRGFRHHVPDLRVSRARLFPATRRHARTIAAALLSDTIVFEVVGF